MVRAETFSLKIPTTVRGNVTLERCAFGGETNSTNQDFALKGDFANVTIIDSTFDGYWTSIDSGDGHLSLRNVEISSSNFGLFIERVEAYLTNVSFTDVVEV